ncbi:DUF1127 domain-containing protein [Actibacterium sp. MT2.3-13A]|uniref:DUF1127 domain-containing protein n=1 Tax=Actibacterium sp. MT2.3-13A TaxID=2828332 RepID=UPI001BA8B771|nr:DUF1127 domain-containing protein [Actibacterium sp. MT2.3-13A]
MAALEQTRPHFDTRPFGGRVSKLFRAGLATLVARHEARATRKALSQLTDRQLEDIGLLRADIARIARIAR